MERYESAPMSFADACLVRMSEQIGNSAVMTLDSDLRIYAIAVWEEKSFYELSGIQS